MRTRFNRYGPKDRWCPKCKEHYHGLEDRCPTCEWSPSTKPVPSTDLGDVVVSMSDPGTYESKERMTVDPKEYGGPEEPLPKGGGIDSTYVCEGYDHPEPGKKVPCNDIATFENMRTGAFFCSAHVSNGSGHNRRLP